MSSAPRIDRGLPGGLGMSRESLKRYNEIHLSESLLPNAARLTHPRVRQEPPPQFQYSPASMTAIRNKPRLRRRWCAAHGAWAGGYPVVACNPRIGAFLPAAPACSAKAPRNPTCFSLRARPTARASGA
jgi:hypothetical protein